MVLTIIAAIFVFGVLVLVHELGHFVTAKLTNMRVDEFAIGFGPKLCSYRYGETTYSIRAFPLGGFNNIAGMDPDDHEAGERGYNAKSVPARMFVILAGSAMNLILPVAIFWGVFCFAGVSTPSPEPVLGTIIAGKPAEQAGLMQGDRILSVDGHEVSSWKDFVMDLQDEEGQAKDIMFERSGEKLEAELVPVYDKSAKRAMIGVMSSVATRQTGIMESMQLACQKTVYIFSQMMSGIGQMIKGAQTEDLAGPLGVAQMAGEVAHIGFVPLLNFAAFLSLNLGIINLFPIPALDGGHFVTLLVEAVRGKPLSAKAVYYAQTVGFALLILLMLFATKNDIMRLFVG
jgi:regulator of sigma E protease